MDKNMLKKAITFEDVKQRLKNIKLENYSKQDILERFIIFGSEAEMNNPEIQRALIKHGFTKELLEMATNINDDVIDEI